MVKQIHAEWYKAVHRPYFRNLILACALLSAGAVAMIYWLRDAAAVADQVNLPFAVASTLFLMVVGLYFVSVGADLVYSDQFKFNTLKNEVSFGLPRWAIYLSRWVVSLLVLLLALAVLAGIYLALSALLLGMPSEATALEQFNLSPNDALVMSLQALANYIFASFPLWLGGLSLMLCLMFLIFNNTFAAFSYLAAVAVLPPMLKELGNYVDPVFTHMYHLTLSYPFDIMNHATGPQAAAHFLLCWGIGLGWSLVSTVVGLAVFQRMEIK